MEGGDDKSTEEEWEEEESWSEKFGPKGRRGWEGTDG